MAKQLYWEDVKVGDEITPMSKSGTTQMVVKWAGGSGDFIPLHYDYIYMTKTQGLDGPIIHGGLKRQWMIHMLTEWTGDPGTIKKFSCEYRGIDYCRPMKTRTEPMEGEPWPWQCKGKVTKKYTEGGEHYLDCDVWVENGKGEITTPGRATLALPSRG